ncbi:MFS transporter [Pantoea ananatis]
MTNNNEIANSPNNLVPVIGTMLAGTFLSRMGYFMTWPYLSVVLYQQFKLSAIIIGTIFFITSFIGVLIGVFTGYWSDKLGRERTLITSLLVSVAGFFLMAYSNHPAEFATAMACIATGRASTESLSKSMIGDHIREVSKREKFQYIRYYIVNIGTALGPLIGTYALVSQTVNVFIISGLIYLLYALMLTAIIVRYPVVKRTGEQINHGIGVSLRILFSQQSFSRLLLCFFLVMFTYVSFDSPLVQLLTRQHFPDLTHTISAIFMTNAFTVIIFQYPVLFLLRRWSTRRKVIFGIFLISLAQILFIMVRFELLTLMVIATFVLSVGELITMPALSVEVDRLAPDHLRGTSFSLINLTSLGTSLCPLFCGFLINAGLVSEMFIFLFITGLISLLIYRSIEESPDYRAFPPPVR